jgi:hypothetical protein
MLNRKSCVVTDALDGKAIDLQLSRVSVDECVEEVKDRKEKGVLNPVIVNRKKEAKNSLSASQNTKAARKSFKKSPNTLDAFLTVKQDFVKKDSADFE